MSHIGEKRMMKRSDFAQKLLDDLRLRKEQLSVSQNCIPSDNIYGFSNKVFEGSKEIKPKSLHVEDFQYKSLKNPVISTEILPYGRGQSMEKIDLTKAVSFALENAGKATRRDSSGSSTSVLSFLHEVRKRSLENVTTDSKRTTQFPMVHVHIKEISKGAQKLNQLVKSCSGDLRFGKGSYSIQCGEQLMEGVIELEHSLRMLVDFKEASNHHGSNKIKLIEEDNEEDEENVTAEVSSRNYNKIKQVARADIKMRLSTLYNKQTRLRSERKSDVSETRIVVEDTKKTLLKPQNGRIPNVVAKLMGLAELPEDENETKNIKFAETSGKKVEERVEFQEIWEKERDKDDCSNSRKRKNTGKVSVKQVLSNKNGESMEKNGVRKVSLPETEQKEHVRTSSPTRSKLSSKKVLARNQQKPVEKLIFEDSKSKEAKHEGNESRKSNEKEKLRRGRKQGNALVTNHSPKPLNSVKMQTKVIIHRDKVKAPRKSFSPKEHSNREDSSQKALQITSSRPDLKIEPKDGDNEVETEILVQKNQSMSDSNEGLCSLIKPEEIQKPDFKEADEEHELLISCKDQKLMKTEAETFINQAAIKDTLEHKREIKDDSILLIACERAQFKSLDVVQHPHDILFIEEQAPISKSNKDANRVPKTLCKGYQEQEKTEILSENETNLKKIVIKSQLFLDTAEALFKLNIPLNLLNSNGSHCNQEEKNLILDCGYELMKRKGRFQELSSHPFMKVPITISSSKVKSLDHLVKELNKELEKLRSFGTDQSLVEDYLERDINQKDPDLNSMWDMGWNETMSAFIEKDDVIRDIEKEVFNGLLEEITRDLISI